MKKLGLRLADTEIRKAKTRATPYQMTDGRGLFLWVRHLQAASSGAGSIATQADKNKYGVPRCPSCCRQGRLGRNLDDLRKLVSDLTSPGVRVRFEKENLTFAGEDSPMSNLQLFMLGAVAQFERELLRERQREGIAIAKAKGNVYRGRKPSLTKEKMASLCSRVKAGEAKATLAKEYGISRASVHNYIRLR
jgi:hypothetical protein